MPKSDETQTNWGFKLDFDLPREKKVEEPAPLAIIPPRQVIGERFPRILEKIELIWGSIELHDYFERTLFVERSNRQGFPQDVMKALGEIHAEHSQLLKSRGLIKDDLWDM